MARFVPIIIQVSGTQDGERVTQQVTNAFKNLNKEAGSAGSQGITSASNAMRNAVISGNLLTDVLRQGLSFLKTWIVDSTLFAGRTQELTIALHQMAKANAISSDDIDKQLQGLIGLNIARQEATQILSQMIGANLDLSKATTLARVAQDTAVISGKNSSQAFVDLTNAILLGNTEAFRAAGIFLSVEDALKKGAKALHLNKDALNEQQRTQILTNAVIEYGSRVTGTYEAAMTSASKQQRSMTRIMDDTKDAVGELFQGAYAAAIEIGSDFLKQIKEEQGGLKGLKADVDSLAQTLTENKAMWKDWGSFAFEQTGHIVEGVEHIVHALQGLKMLLEDINNSSIVLKIVTWLNGIPDITGTRYLDYYLRNQFQEPAAPAPATRTNPTAPGFDPFGRSTPNVLPGVGPRANAADNLFARIAPEIRNVKAAIEKTKVEDTRTEAQKRKAERAAQDAETVREMRGVVTDLATWFKGEFGKALPYKFGQTAFETKLGYDHRAAADVSVNPLSPEGRAILKYLDEEGIAYRASTGREISKTTGKLISSAAHIHVGALSRGLGLHEQLVSGAQLRRELQREEDRRFPEGFTVQEMALTSLERNRRPKHAETDAGDLSQLPVELQRKWDLYYDNAEQREQALKDRRKDFAAEYEVTQRNIITEIGNLNLDLAHIRAQNADDQFVEQRRLLMAKGEEVDLLKRIGQVEDAIATGPYNEALRLQLSYEQAILNVQRDREAALVRNIQNQVILAHQMDVDFARLNDGVVEFLAQQKSLQQTFQDVRTNSVRSFFDGIDSAIDRMTKHLGLAGQALGTFLKDLAHLAASQLLQRILGIGGGGAGAGYQVSGGGGGGGGSFFGNLIGNIFGGGGGRGSGSTQTGGFAGGSGGGQYLFGGSSGVTNPQTAQAAALASIFGGGGISVPPSLSTASGQLTPQQIAAIAQGNVSGGGGSGFSLAGLGQAAPFLGAGLGFGIGSSFGRGASPLASILGGVGLGAVGLVAGSALPAILAGSFAGLTALGAATLGIGAALAVAAFIIGKNAQRRKDETTRNAISNDTGTAIWKLIDDARKLGTSASLARWNEIQTNYFNQIAQIKDSKTRRHAELQWQNDFLPLLEIVKARAKEGDAAKQFSSAFVPTFAGGGLVPYRGGMNTLIKVTPGELMIPPGGGFGVNVPGVDRGYDSVLTAAPVGTRVLTKPQQARIRGFAGGGVVGGGSNAPSIGGAGSDGPIELTAEFYFDGDKIVARGLKNTGNRQFIIKEVRTHVANERSEGLLGDIANGLTRRV